jgi:hypothetical protein
MASDVACKLYVLPLDIRSTETAPSQFNAWIVATLEFPAGVVKQESISTAIAAHPLLGLAPGSKLRGTALGYAVWEQAGRRFTPETGIPLSLTYIGNKPLATRQSILAKYLGGEDERPVAIIRHDASFDQLTPDHFVEVIQAHDDLAAIRANIQALAGKKLRMADSRTAVKSSYAKARWLNAHVQASLLNALYPSEARSAKVAWLALEEVSLQRLRVAVKKITRRITTDKDRPVRALDTSLRSSTVNSDSPVSLLDPNVAIHAALRNQLLAESCGLTTLWSIDSPQTIKGDYVLLLDLESLLTGSSTPLASTLSTAFRRERHTHPLSFVDVDRASTSNSGLAQLSDISGQERYRATTIHAETSLAHATLLQENNSLSNSLSSVKNVDENTVMDERPPQLLSEDHLGVNETECAGIVISAPILDLAPVQALVGDNRASRLPCLFLEDCWIGFRLDMGQRTASALASVHRHTQELLFRDGVTSVSGKTEDFFAREQPDDKSVEFSSTEILRYVGLSSAQARDYSIMLGTSKECVLPEDAPFKQSIASYEGATALRFGNEYRYRLRNVLLGGVSFSDEESDALGLDSVYSQTVPFFRARAFRPGELIALDSQPTSASSREVHSFFLTDENPRARVLIVPTPIDMDVARYHGLFLADSREPERDKNRVFVKDLGSHFKHGISKLDYYFDPDVREIIIQAKLLNGDPDSVSRAFDYHNGSYCELAEHMYLPPVKASYGNQLWETFVPIEVVLETTSERKPRITSKQHWSKGYRVEIHVPKGADMEISILPSISSEQLFSTAYYAASAIQFKVRKAAENDASWATSLPVPAIAEQKFRVVHCVRKPLAVPSLVSVTTDLAVTDEPIVIGTRDLFDEKAQIPGYVEIDAATTGQLKLQATWLDIDDSPVHGTYVLTPAKSDSVPRSIVFDRYSPPTGQAIANVINGHSWSVPTLGPYDLWDMFDLQCAENKVFLGNAALPESSSPSGAGCAIHCADTRRKALSVVSVGTSRYKAHFRTDDPSHFEVTSMATRVDVPASMRLPAPDISHIVPLIRDRALAEAGRSSRRHLYAMRVYVRRPWFMSGLGERLAIGCGTGEEENLPRPSLNKLVTHWGEDPIDRPHLDLTIRPPRASDFRSTATEQLTAIDENLYSPRGQEGASDVIYRDNVPLRSDSSNGSVDRLSVASFALRWSQSMKMWFCDVLVPEDFVGWCGLALYRHQPLSHEGTQLSVSAAFAYGAILHGETVSWVEKDGKLHVTIGPVFDRYTSFALSSIEYRDGVSERIPDNATKRTVLKAYKVKNETYFEGIVVKSGFHWSLVKLRFDEDIASIEVVGR